MTIVAVLSLAGKIIALLTTQLIACFLAHLIAQLDAQLVAQLCNVTTESLGCQQSTKTQCTKVGSEDVPHVTCSVLIIKVQTGTCKLAAACLV